MDKEREEIKKEVEALYARQHGLANGVCLRSNLTGVDVSVKGGGMERREGSDCS